MPQNKDKNKNRQGQSGGQPAGQPGGQQFGREQGSDIPEYLRREPGQGGDTSGMSGDVGQSGQENM